LPDRHRCPWLFGLTSALALSISSAYGASAAPGSSNHWFVYGVLIVGLAILALLAVIVSLLRTRNKRLKASLPDDDGAWRVLANGAPIMVWIGDAAGKHGRVNDRWREFAGPHGTVPADEGWLEAVHPEDHSVLEQSMQRQIASGDREMPEVRLRRADGSYRWMMMPSAVYPGRTDKPARVTAAIDITERKQAEGINLDFAHIVEYSSDAIISTDANGTVLSWNRAATEILGYTAIEAIGRPIRDLIVPDELAHEHAYFAAELRAGRSIVARDTRRRRKDGTLIDLALTLSPIPSREGSASAYAAIMRDISERRRAERERAQYATIVQAASDAMFIRSADGIIQSWNAAAECIFGYTAEEIVGQPSSILVPPESLQEFEDFNRRIARGESIPQMRSLRVRKDGSRFHAAFSKSVVRDSNGATTGTAVVVLRDVSERVQAEEQEQRRVTLARLLDGLALDASSARSPEEAMAACLERLCDHGQWSIGHVAVFRLESEELTIEKSLWRQNDQHSYSAFIAASNSYPDYAQKSRYFVGSAIATRKPVWRNDLSLAESPRLKLAVESGLRSGFAFPVFVEDKVAAVLEFLAREERAPDEELLSSIAMVSSYLTRAIEKQRAEERLRFMAQFDQLTGLPNNVLFRDRLGQALARAARQETLVGVLCIELDHFKQVNEVLGREAGDIILKAYAHRLQTTLRDVDTIARPGADTFWLLLENMRQLDELATIAQKIVALSAEPFVVADRDVFVTASVGVSVFPFDTQMLERLVEHAETAVQQVKKEGRNNFQFYTGVQPAVTNDPIDTGARLRRALERDELRLYYQPKLDLQTGTIKGAEALMRWQNTERGLISPAHFIPLAEETGLIVPMGEWALRTACSQAMRWRTVNPGFTIAVNLSPRQFRHQNLMAVITTALQESGLPAEALELEITESMAMTRPEQTRALLDSLRELGAKLSVDDFGTGYSSLSYLRRFPLDTLKVDQSFVRDIESDSDVLAIVTTIVGMAKTLGLRTVAEGIETAGQLARLAQLGCNEGQGYFFAKPLPPEEFTRFLGEWKPETLLHDKG
jgi:diguanylate cyclase (GGDEF)-like protein/PAS domain S-box-containing protein